MKKGSLTASALGMILITCLATWPAAANAAALEASRQINPFRDTYASGPTGLASTSRRTIRSRQPFITERLDQTETDNTVGQIEKEAEAIETLALLAKAILEDDAQLLANSVEDGNLVDSMLEVFSQVLDELLGDY